MSQIDQNSNQQIKPKHVFIGLVLLNLFLGLIVIAFPKGEHRLGADLTLQFVSYNQLLGNDSVTTVDIDSVIATVETIDTAQEFIDTSVLNAEIPERQIEYFKDSSGLLDYFFKALEEQSSRRVVRILHYGDSQLEGDRISDYLRNKMQLTFGGYGPGYILPKEPTAGARTSVYVTQSPDWKKQAIYGNLEKAGQGKYGIGGASFYYTGSYSKLEGIDTSVVKVFAKDTIGKDSLDQFVFKVDTTSFVLDTVINKRYTSKEMGSSWLSFRNGRNTYLRAKKYNQIGLYFHNTEPFSVTLSAAGKDTIINVVKPHYWGKINMHTPWVTKNTKVNFIGESPQILGASLDGRSGVAVDNFPMRGSSGLGFETINTAFYKNQLNQLNTRLLILQYGINVIPNPQKSYAFYKRMFSAQLKAIRLANPEVSILIIGPSDMSRKRNGQYVSYPNVPLVRNAMKEAAFENNCAFWDLYEAMGGENSMVSWVNSKPSLAAKDFTHFNHRGAKFVGEMLFKALYYDYQLYLAHRTQ